MSKAVEIEGYMLRVHTRHYDKVNGVVVCKKGENDKMFFPFKRPHGKWIDDVCSCCGMESEYNTLYCGGCGAYMENGFPSCGYGEARKGGE